MRKISITKRGFRAVKWDTDAGLFADVEVGSHVSLLRTACSIDPDVTLADIFAAVAGDGPLKEFLRQYSACDVDAFHAEALMAAGDPPNLPDLEYIEISKYLDFDEDQAQQTLDVEGVGKANGDRRTRYGIDLTPVSELAPLPIRLNPVAEVRKDFKTIDRAPATFTLLDVLGEIYWEISFHGSPAQRDGLMAYLVQAAEEVKAGTATLTPLEEPGTATQ